MYPSTDTMAGLNSGLESGYTGVRLIWPKIQS